VAGCQFAERPSLFGGIAERLDVHKPAGAETRIVVAKPCGHKLETAKALNASRAQYCDETQIYRIDH